MKPAILSKDLKNILSEFGIVSIISNDMNYIDLTDKEDEVSFLPSEREDILKDKDVDPWKSHRNRMKIGKFFNRVMYMDEDRLENLVNWYKAVYNIVTEDYNKVFRIVHGRDIVYWYNQRNYVTGGGTLNNSCMRGSSDDRFDLYVDNPDVCKLLIMVDEKSGKLLARALMWETDKGIYIDRPYCRYDKDHMLYKKFAEKNGYNSYYNRKHSMTVKLKSKIYNNPPYLDTFRYDTVRKILISR